MSPGMPLRGIDYRPRDAEHADDRCQPVQSALEYQRAMLSRRPGLGLLLAAPAFALVAWVVPSGYGMPKKSAPALPVEGTPTEATPAPAEAVRLSAEVAALLRAGKPAQALPLAERVVALVETGVGTGPLGVGHQPP